jgi:hypothetical protein
MSAIAPGRCFLPRRDGSVYLIVNWEQRRADPDPLVLIRLSPRHRAIWATLRRRRRSDKSILYALFTAAARRSAKRRSISVPIRLDSLTNAELARLAQAHLERPVANLDRLGRTGLIDLVQALYPAMPPAQPKPEAPPPSQSKAEPAPRCSKSPPT